MGSDAINLRDQVATLRRRWRWLVLCSVGGMLLALAASFAQPTLYKSSTSLEISPVTAAQTASNGLVMQPAEIATQLQVLQSTPVAERVIARLNLDVSSSRLLNSVEATQDTEARVISMTATQPTASQAQKVASAFAEEYLSFRVEQANQATEDAQAALQDAATATRKQLADIEIKLATATDAERAQLQSEQQALLVELTQILSDQATASVNSPGALGGGGQVLVPASLPGGPSEPRPVRSAMLGLFLGLLLGIVLAFVRDHFDDAVRDEARLREAITPLPVLGRIPRWANAKSGRLATVLEPGAHISEAYRALTINVRFLLAVAKDRHGTPVAAGLDVPLSKARRQLPLNRGGKVLLVTSATEAEGKTSLASNLAVVAAQFGLKVIVVDADLRSPKLASVFGLGRPPGLSDLLATDDDVDDYLVEVETLKVLAGGSLAPNPAELLASPRMHQILTTLASRADLVIVDSAPTTRVADALELVAVSDLVLLSVRHAQTRLRSLHEAIDRIKQVGGEVSGVVYVDVPSRSAPEAYGYGQNYAPDSRATDPDSRATDPDSRATDDPE